MRGGAPVKGPESDDVGVADEGELVGLAGEVLFGLGEAFSKPFDSEEDTVVQGGLVGGAMAAPAEHFRWCPRELLRSECDAVIEEVQLPG